MNMFSPAELTQNYVAAGKAKAEKPFLKSFVMAILAGAIIALGAATANTAIHSIDNVSAAKTIAGLLFPFGLGMVMLLGAELFTGNTMICISVASKETTLLKMLRSWLIVYFGNFVGAGLIAYFCANFGQFGLSSGYLAVYTVKIAAAKSALPFGNAFVLGILCNILVSGGVLCAMSAKDTSGKILGAYIPVVFFIICGFEHCVANMYYIPAGIFAMNSAAYKELIANSGIDLSVLTWGNFIVKNLVPVTLGNIVGGAGIGLSLWYSHLDRKKK